MALPSGDYQYLELSVDKEGRLRKVTAITMKEILHASMELYMALCIIQNCIGGIQGGKTYDSFPNLP